jgi:predicted aspartyl protease
MQVGNLFVPVTVNGKTANYIVDTGADFSLMSKGEPKRLSLKVIEAPGSSTVDSSGTSVGFRLALADRLSVGEFELRNVVFLVARDDQQPFVDLPADSHGVPGIPVVVAFETLRWSADGRFEIGFK